MHSIGIYVICVLKDLFGLSTTRQAVLLLLWKSFCLVHDFGLLAYTLIDTIYI